MRPRAASGARTMAWLALLVSQSIAGAETVHLTRDINPGAGSSTPRDFAVVDDTLFFSANDGVDGFELWKSDGTEEGTVLVADINPPGGLGFGHSSPSSPVAVGGVLLFAANDGVTGRELWRSDGTAEGTDRVRDIVPGAVGSDPDELLAVDGTVYFSAMGPDSGRELWKSDGTEDGTRIVADIAHGFGASSTPRFLARVGDSIFFSARNARGRELWKTDGSKSGTVLVEDINPSGSSFPESLTAVGGLLFFAANDGDHGKELWRSDGTPQGTRMVRDIAPGATSSNPSALAVFGGRLYFSAFDPAHGRELWTSDGTRPGTTRVKDIFPGVTSSEAADLVSAAGRLFFAAAHPDLGTELWATDGTRAGTQVVADIGPGSASGLGAGFGFFYLTRVPGGVYFAADDGEHGSELWRSDGSDDGTTLVADVAPGPDGALAHLEPVGVVRAGSLVFFLADDGEHGLELWATPF